MLKLRRWRSPSYLNWVRTLECSNCRTGTDIIAHHIIDVGDGITGDKAPDYDAVPLCTRCHEMIHREPDVFPQLTWRDRVLRQAFGEGVLGWRGLQG